MLVAAIRSLLRVAPATWLVLLPTIYVHGQTAGSPKTLLEYHANSDTSTSVPQSIIRTDPAVSPAEHTVEVSELEPVERFPAAAPAREDRRLAPPSGKRTLKSLGSQEKDDSVSLAVPQMESLTTAGAGLAIVVGLFMLCMWLFRRSGPKATSPLPQEAVAVLGRVPLAGSHFVHLLRLGSKLVLVAVGPDSVTSLAEVNDPNEVQHLLGLCLQNHRHSTTAEFQQVLEKLAQEPARGFLEKNMAAAAYARSGKS